MVIISGDNQPELAVDGSCITRDEWSGAGPPGKTVAGGNPTGLGGRKKREEGVKPVVDDKETYICRAGQREFYLRYCHFWSVVILHVTKTRKLG